MLSQVPFPASEAVSAWELWFLNGKTFLSLTTEDSANRSPGHRSTKSVGSATVWILHVSERAACKKLKSLAYGTRRRWGNPWRMGPSRRKSDTGGHLDPTPFLSLPNHHEVNRSPKLIPVTARLSNIDDNWWTETSETVSPNKPFLKLLISILSILLLKRMLIQIQLMK